LIVGGNWSGLFGRISCSIGRHDEVKVMMMFANGEENKFMSDGGEGKIRIWKFRSYKSREVERVGEITCSSKFRMERNNLI
jgi:hypothetical protein